MATKFVYSAASGLNDGTSWLNAWTSIASATGVAAGDTVKVEYRHSQTGLAANVSFSNGTNTNPVYIISCDKDNSDALRAGAVVEWTSASAIGVKGSIYTYGVTWSANSSGILDITGTDNHQVHESGTLRHNGSAGAGAINVTTARFVCELINENVDFSGASSASCSLACFGQGTFIWRGGTYTCRATQTNLITNNIGTSETLFQGVNFSGTVTNLFEGTTVLYGYARFSNCIPPTYTNVVGVTPTVEGWEIALDGFASGTLTAAALPPTNRVQFAGTIKADLTRYRTGGANDGSNANAYSWQFATNSKAGLFFAALHSPTITRWVTAGSHTITVYIASGGTQQDNGVWLEVLSPSEAGSATAQSRYQSTRTAPLATPANLTTDGVSTWTGTGVGTLQKIVVSIAPAIAGVVEMRVNFGNPSAVVYVDPEFDVDSNVSGNSRFMGGVQVFSPTGGGASGGFVFGG